MMPDSEPSVIAAAHAVPEIMGAGVHDDNQAAVVAARAAGSVGPLLCALAHSRGCGAELDSVPSLIPLPQPQCAECCQ